MIRLSKSVGSLGALAVAAGALTLALPRAAHAVAEALVQVTNTVTTQETSRQASQLVHLTVQLSSDFPAAFNLVTVSGPIANYNVPTTASLVINTIDITPAIDSAGASFSVHLAAGLSRVNLEVPSQPSLAQLATLQFNYPSGIVFAPGTVPGIQVQPNNGSSNDVIVDLFGYLTNN